MEEVVKNTHAFVDVLCMARGEAVQGWDEDTFQRAFKWAQYFEQVYNKLKSKPGLADKLDKYINNFNKTSTVYLGHIHLSFAQLENSKNILRNCLLQNPYLSNSQFRHVLKLYGITIGSVNDRTDLETFQKDVVVLMKHKGTLKLLSQMRDKLTDDLIQLNHKIEKESSEQRTNILDTWTHSIAQDSTGELLFKYVQHILQYSGSKDQHCISDKLAAILSQDHGIDTIVSCLLYFPDDCQSHTKAQMTQRIVLKWLLDSLESKKTHPFWHLSAPCLSKVSFKYEDIFKIYLERLISWGNKMVPVLTYQLSDQERLSLSHNQVYIWRCSDGPFVNGEHGTTFEDFVQHFVHLMCGPAHIQECCHKILKSSMDNYSKLPIVDETAKKLGANYWKDVCQSL